MKIPFHSRSRIIVGHAISNDLRCLGISESVNSDAIRDTQKHYKSRYHDFKTRGFDLPPLRNPGDQYSLKTLAKHILGETVQEGAHNAIEDARTTMKLYRFDEFKFEEHVLKWEKWWDE